MKLEKVLAEKNRFLEEIQATENLDEALNVLEALNSSMDWEQFEDSTEAGTIAGDELKSVGRVLVKHLESNSRQISLFSRGLLSHLAVQLKRGEIVTLRSALTQLIPHFRANSSSI